MSTCGPIYTKGESIFEAATSFTSIIGELQLVDFHDDEIPPYAILSHTWGDEEVSYEEFKERGIRRKDGSEKRNAGWKKIELCRRQAAMDNIKYFWIDTCCIDKSNSAELSEAINWMFRWYQRAVKCYVHMVDVLVHADDQTLSSGDNTWKSAFKASRWFTRGWTLLELLAPRDVEFYSGDGHHIGSKKSLEKLISAITAIPIPALRGEPLAEFSVKERFYWARSRQTSRQEDEAYALLGIFDVQMPLLYGEGSNAIERLRREIYKRTHLPFGGETLMTGSSFAEEFRIFNAEMSAVEQRCLQSLHPGLPYYEQKNQIPSRAPNTCLWALQNSGYLQWRDNNEKTLLWISGGPGCGKSVLAKCIVDEDLPGAFQEEPSKTVLYHFFTKTGQAQQTACRAISSILHQLFIFDPRLIRYALPHSIKNGAALSTMFSELCEIFMGAVTGTEMGEIICVFDALDECDEQGQAQMLEFLAQSCLRRQYSGLRFLVTSRPFQEFQELMQASSTIAINFNDEQGKVESDTILYIRHHVAKLTQDFRLNPTVSNHLQKRLLEFKQQSFIWLNLLFESIRDHPIGPRLELDDLIDGFPMDLDQIYEHMLSKCPDPEFARKVLQIVLVSKRPLTVTEMDVALHIKELTLSYTELELQGSAKMRATLPSRCAHMVTIVDSKIYFVHATVKDFLTSMGSTDQLGGRLWQQSLDVRKSHRVLANICLRLFCLKEVTISSTNLCNAMLPEEARELTPNAYCQSKDFLSYSAIYWADHFQGQSTSDGIEIIQTLFSADDYSPVIGQSGINYGSIFHAASFGGHNEIVKMLLEDGQDVNAQSGRFGSALLAASVGGHEEVVEILLGNGARPNAEGGFYGNALLAASEAGHDAVVRLLLEYGADPDAQGGDYGSALQAASAGGHEAVVKLLLERGNYSDTQGGRLSNALLAASAGHHEAVVEMLLAYQRLGRVDSDGAFRSDEQEDSDSQSDLTDASSSYSVVSSTTSFSAHSTREKFPTQIVEHLVSLLSEDRALNEMYHAAMTRFSRDMFLRVHDRLLKKYLKNLRIETRNPIELATVRSLRNRDRRQAITTQIYDTYQAHSTDRQQAMMKLKAEKPMRRQLLEKFLRGEKASATDDSLQPTGEDLEQIAQPVDEERSSNSSDVSSGELSNQSKEKTLLKPLENFITKGDAFVHLKKTFTYLINPPTNLKEALKSNDHGIVHRFLTRKFETAATSGFAWLHELDDAGYSTRDMATLLLEDMNDTPWIYFTPSMIEMPSIRLDVHVYACAHQRIFRTHSTLVADPVQFTPPPPSQIQVRRTVEELCGIGGVAPLSRNMESWFGRVIFEDQSAASISVDSSPLNAYKTIMNRVMKVLGNFCTAAATVQSAGLCCDSFTVLLRKEDCVELRRIQFRDAIFMENALKQTDLQSCAEKSRSILQAVKVPTVDRGPRFDLHCCALAAQYLCLAFLSYTQAHIGLPNPFFLDKPLQKIVLLGIRCSPGNFSITAELVKLSCLAEMTKDPVLAFSLETTHTALGSQSNPARFDVLASAEDCLDTWGPGYLIHDSTDPSSLHAVVVGGGFVSLINSKKSSFHWTKGHWSERLLRATFGIDSIMRIGAGILVNERCCIDEIACRQSLYSDLEELGTREPYWQNVERQAGIQGGQYLLGIYNNVWQKFPGITLKQVYLERADEDLFGILDRDWGLQVSFCTSVARRVPLRELVADLVPVFNERVRLEVWQEPIDVDEIVRALTHGDLFAWLTSRPAPYRSYLATLIRTILEQLQHTGLDRQNAHLLIAWPKQGQIGRGLKIPCKAETFWARVIADSEDCATFAYVTPKCLETDLMRCQGTLRQWQHASKMLVTQMSPCRLRRQNNAASHVVANIATGTTTMISPQVGQSTAPMPLAQWELKDRETYFIKKFNNWLRVKVEKSDSAKCDVTQLIVENSKIPQAFLKRVAEKSQSQIRERQMVEDHAELVIVRTA